MPIAHQKYVDGLRAVAVIVVLLSHVMKHSPDLFRTHASRIMQLGQHGVELFFVISGFCLAYPYLSKRSVSAPFRFDSISFFAKRINRILPPYYVCVLIFALLALTPIWRIAAQANYGHGMTANLSLQGLLQHFIFNARESQELNGSFWTLRIEAMWYLLFPSILFAYMYKPTWFVVFGLSCTAAAILHIFREPFGTFDKLVLALPAFMLGIIAADMRVKTPTIKPLLAILIPLFAIIAVASDLSSVQWTRLVWDILAFQVVVLAGTFTPLTRALSLPIPIAIGIASYSIYLVHEPVIAILEHIHFWPPIAAIAGLAIGFAFWYAVEQPLTQAPMRKRLFKMTAAFLKRLIPRRPSVTIAASE